MVVLGHGDYRFLLCCFGAAAFDAPFKDQTGHPPVGVADAELPGAGCHPGKPPAVQEQRDDVPAHLLRGERVVRHDQGAAGGDQAGGIEGLLAVADGQGHEYRGHAHGGDFADRRCPGAGEQHVCGGVDRFHPVDVFHLPVPGCRERVAVGIVDGLVPAGDVQGLDPGFGEGPDGSGDGPVDALGSRRSRR